MNANKQDAGGLLPCPWCRVSPEERTVPSGGGSYYFAVRCRNWDCPVQPETDEFETPQDAIAAWNRRNGEHCRAASVDEDTSWLAQQIEGARDYATGGCVRPDDDDPDEQKWWDDLTRAAQILRALSRGVPEDTTRLDWLTAPDAIDRHVSQCLNGEWCAQDDVVSAHYGATPREAIDTAIAAQRKEG
jgi:hypothetical protein